MFIGTISISYHKTLQYRCFNTMDITGYMDELVLV